MITAGLPTGVLVLAVSIGVRDGRFDYWGTKTMQRRPGVWMLVYFVIFTPALLVSNFFQSPLNRDDDLALKMLLLTTGLAAYAFGWIMATMNHFDDDAAKPDPRLRRVTPSPSERGDVL